MEKQLLQSILKTVVYFDIVDFPLTREELYLYLWESPAITYTDFNFMIAQYVTQGFLQEKWGYYFLPGREMIVEERRKKVVPIERLLKKASRASRLINWIPCLEAIFICNSIASETATNQSDIDFFIITKSGRTWLVRFFSNVILYCAGIRRHGKYIASRICLSFYVDEYNLNLAPQKIAYDDIHFTYWINQMIPLYDPQGWYVKFRQANVWTAHFVPHAMEDLPRFTPVPGSIRSQHQWFKNFGEFFLKGRCGEMVENFLKKIQQLKMKHSSKNLARDDRGVIIADGVIKLHERDTRKAYREKWLVQTKNILENVT
jgi:hypothetical protein